MEAEALLNLFDSFWFYSQISQKQSKTLISSAPEQKPSKRIVSTPLRSKSEEIPLSYYASNSMMAAADISSPDSVLQLKSHLQTILSQRELSVEIPKKPFKGYNNLKKKKKEKRLTKSLSQLEFDEVKGFIDLGFEFSEEDKEDSSLVEIIPGLQRLGRAHEEFSGPRARPYLSEAWQVWDKQKEEDLLMKWKIPAVSNEIDMKDSLKWWAHSVASAVR